jgi:euchromatic histone-lysine N-methyltransferase
MFFNFLLTEGIEVGYQFYSRAEMVAVGFHSHWLNGIDYMGQSYTKVVIQLLFVLFLHISLVLNIIISNRF